jgi:hypothetical protein
VHADEIDIVTRSPGSATSTSWWPSRAPTLVEVPIDLAIASEAASIDLDLDATLRSPFLVEDEGIYQVDAVANEPWNGSGASLPIDVDPSWEEQSINALVEIQPDGLSPAT